MTPNRELVFRNTTSQKGRHLAVTPRTSAMERLHYGRILLDSSVPRAAFETGAREVGLMCLSGACEVEVNGESYALGPYDSLYVPRGSVVAVTTKTQVDLVDFEAEVEGDYPVQVVRYADVQVDPTLKFQAGGDSSSRTLNVLLGGNVKAGRILGGFTRSLPGNWTSWPPHEHATMLEELYVFFDMPAPAFGIQCVYGAGAPAPGDANAGSTNAAPDLAVVVHDGDAVCIPRGYHPNVAVPGHPI